MANSALKTKIAAIKKKVDRDVFKVLIDAQLYRRTGARSDTGGQRAFAAPVDIEIKVQGVNRWTIGSSMTLADAKHKVTVYDVQVDRGDKLQWGDDGVAHVVLMVMGLLRNPANERYHAKVVTN